MKYFIPQIDYSDCGFACLKMMVASLYQNKDALYIKQDESHGPYSLLDIKKEANKYGISLIGKEYTDKQLIKEIKLPFIALLQKKNNVCHYVLVTKTTKRSVYYLDPDEGEMRTSIKSFNKLWSSISLEIEQFIKDENISFPKEIKENKQRIVLTTFLQFLTALFMITGIYFLDDKSMIYLPLIFLSLAFISEVILRIYLIKRMERLDEVYMQGTIIYRQNYLLFYKRYEEYKKSSVVTNLNFIFSFLTILFVAVMIIINNVYNSFVLLIPLLISLFDIKIITPFIKSKEQMISIEERELDSLKNLDSFKRQIKKLHIRGYSLAKAILIKKYLVILLLLIVSIITTVFNETFSLPYVIFYFALCYFLLEQYMNFMNYPSLRNEKLRYKVKLMNLIQ